MVYELYPYHTLIILEEKTWAYKWGKIDEINQSYRSKNHKYT